MNDSVTVEKIQAMKNYNNFKAQFLYKFILCTLTTIISCSVVSYSFWFPSMSYLCSFSLANICSFFFTAKFLFVVGNIIVIILIRESKSASNSSPATEIYDEYIARSRRNYRALPHSNYIHANKKRQEEKMENTEGKMLHAEKKKEVKMCNGVETEIVKRGKREKDEEDYIPTEELNRRVEAYIARVNRQRLLEAKSLMSGRA